MAKNFPGPYQLRFDYTVVVSSVGLSHRMWLNVALQTDPAPGTTFDNINLLGGGVTVRQLDTEVDIFVGKIKKLWSTAFTMNFVDLWKYTPLSYDAAFVSTYNIGVAGTSGSGAVSAGQNMFVFRTSEGSTMRLNLMESVRAASGPINAASLSADEADVVNYMIDPTTGQNFLGLDTSYPFAFTNLFPGQNEAIFKKRYRP